MQTAKLFEYIKGNESYDATTMKITALVFLMLLRLSTATHSQSIPNNGFESWSSNASGIIQPDGWETQNEPGMIFVDKGTGLTGAHSACLKVVWDPMLKTGSGATMTSGFELPGSVQTRGLSGFYSASGSHNDTLVACVELFLDRELIAKGNAALPGINDQWTSFEVVVDYLAKRVPNRMKITFTISGPVDGSHFTRYCIDDLHLLQ